ncbi:Tyrosine recombinase XerC [Methylobacterium crusticola]|uniref:Tyrosine recombinase XerC n=1 Tax=Methylobacterium crusticola TaxID=1697972 RepID=A0ABQ4R2R2_9HYPH|nr:site-specific integrase [Methylobacterium crusticola]GJD51052.1 Tyrosine recombinase XerC [Methylobacterium crusticola]
MLAAAAPLRVAAARQPVGFDELVKGWAAEKRPAEKTRYEWTRVMAQFSSFLGHEDAARVTPDDVQRWKEALIAKGLAPKTISDGKLVELRSIFQWTADNRRLMSNPAERVSMDVKRKASETIRIFTDEEASIVLRAALTQKDPVLRWVPWLCAYSGARVSEVCQLRVQDVCQIEGVWCMRFDPEVGPLKTASSERAVPLHQALLDPVS